MQSISASKSAALETQPLGGLGRWLPRLALAVPPLLLVGLLASGASARWADEREARDPAAMAQLRNLAGLGEDSEAYRRLRQLAEGGAPLAQRGVGELLLASRQSQQRQEGLDWLAKAAAQQDVEAQFALGKAAFQGVNGGPDFALARQWFEQADRAGHPAAPYFLGLMYRSGYGLPADTGRARAYFSKAAAADLPEGAFMLANQLRAGEGGPQDWSGALANYVKAGDMEHPAALQTLAMIYQNGEMGQPRDPAQAEHYLAEASHALMHYHAP